MELENYCCPYLEVQSCGDTERHNHLLCSLSMGIISNQTVKKFCINDIDNCLLVKMKGGE